MANQVTQVNGPVPLKNVAAFMVMTQRLVDRDLHLPGIGVASGPSGYGKSFASIYAQNKTRAIRVEVGDSWTRRSLLAAILHELGRTPQKRTIISDMAAEAINFLADDPRRPLIVDEADKLVDKGFIELVRELHEHSGVPIILIGEEKLPTKLLAFERVHNRVLDWLQVQPCDLEDTQALAKAFAPKMTIDDDLLAQVCAQSGGRARRIVVNVSRIAELGKNKGKMHLGLKDWGAVPFYTGEPPLTRHVEPFKRTPKLAAA